MPPLAIHPGAGTNVIGSALGFNKCRRCQCVVRDLCGPYEPCKLYLTCALYIIFAEKAELFVPGRQALCLFLLQMTMTSRGGQLLAMPQRRCRGLGSTNYQEYWPTLSKTATLSF